jgi:hypothetical protein
MLEPQKADQKPARIVAIAMSGLMDHKCLELEDTRNTSALSVALTIEAS